MSDRLISFLFAVAVSGSAFAQDFQEPKDTSFFRPFVSIGFNSVQGTSLLLGTDIGDQLDENWSAGGTLHFSAGDKPNRDREFGIGAFLGYTRWLGDYLIGQVREEVSHLEQRRPIQVGNYEKEAGIASITSLGFTLMMSDNIAISAGYRFVLGLTNSDLGEGRSGPTVGINLGI